MWETLIKVTYEDFVPDDDDDDKLYYKYLVRNFESCLADVANIFENSFSGQVPGTKEQGNSEIRLQECCFPITVSVCKKFVLVGEKIKKKADAKHQCFDWIKNHFWFPNSLKTLDMKYGIQNESKAIAIYSSETGNKVVISGLWIYAKYLHLGAGPAELILDDSFINVKVIVEVKYLKIFRGRSTEQIIQQKLPEQSKQCFKVVDNKILLKTSHSYYDQIQLQLLVTEAKYCDFVLYSDIGKIYLYREYLRINPFNTKLLKLQKFSGEGF